MNNIFTQFYELNKANNTLWIVLATIMLVVLASKYLGKLLARLLYALLKKLGRAVNKEHYYNLLINPIRNFAVGFTVIIALEKLTLPNAVKNLILYHKFTLGELLNMVGTIAFIILIIKLLLSIIEYSATILEQKANLTASQGDNQLISFFKDLIRVVVIIMAVLLILKYAFGQDVGNLLTGLSIVGAAIALATKESLENLIASFIIFFDKPFVTGDNVKVQTVTGQVEKIGLRSTRIRTDDKTYVTVPNKQMVDSIVDNQSLRTKRKQTIKLELNKHTPLAVVQQVIVAINGILHTNKALLTHYTHLESFNKMGITIQLEYYTNPIDDVAFNAIKEEVNMALLQLLHELNITLPNEVAVG